MDLDKLIEESPYSCYLMEFYEEIVGRTFFITFEVKYRFK